MPCWLSTGTDNSGKGAGQRMALSAYSGTRNGMVVDSLQLLEGLQHGHSISICKMQHMHD